MAELLNPSTQLSGASPYRIGEFSVTNKPVMLRAFGFGADDRVSVRYVRKVQIDSASLELKGCGVDYPDDPVLAGSEYLTDCGTKITICQAQPWVVIVPNGLYELEVSGTNINNHLVTIEAVEWLNENIPSACTACKACEAAVVPPVPVTAAFTPCPATFPMKWDFDQQVYPSLAAWKAAISNFMGVTVGYTAPCTFTAPAGSVFPALTLSAPPAPPVPNTQVLSPCPAFPTQWAGQVYANATAFAAGVSAYGAGWSYNISTCTFTAPQGATFPAVPSAAPVSPITGVACPLTFPLIYQNINCANALALDQAIEQTLGVSVTVSSVAPCQVVQTSGAVGSMPASIVVSAVPVIPPIPANTGVLSDCAGAYPKQFQGVNFPDIFALKQAIESFYSVQTSYDTATCTFTKVGGSGLLPASIAIESGCSYYLTGDTWDNNAGVPQFRCVLGNLPATGFTQQTNNAGTKITLLRNTAGTQCGITFNYPFLDNSGVVIGYGAQL
jgi:hypothetical protein